MSNALRRTGSRSSLGLSQILLCVGMLAGACGGEGSPSLTPNPTSQTGTSAGQPPTAGTSAAGVTSTGGVAGTGQTPPQAGTTSLGGASAGSGGTPPAEGGSNAGGMGGGSAGSTGVGGAGASPPGFGGCRIGAQLHTDDFMSGTGKWVAELETPGQSAVTAAGGKLDISAADGATVWFMPVLSGNVDIDYHVTVVVQNGANDHLTDLNSFWMATDPANANLFTRSGKFADYNALNLYYVGFGGNANTTTRIRRYEGVNTRPDPISEFTDAPHLLVANHDYHVQHIACGKHIAYIVDATPYFQYEDDKPYTSGRFAFRTVGSHEQISAFSVSSLTTP